MNPVEKAVAPLKEQAIERAVIEANKMIAKVEKELIENNYDRRAAAPYPPRSLGSYGSEYDRMKMKYQLFCYLTKSRKYTGKMSEPDFADMNPEMVERFIENAKADAAAQYESFVAKLVKKVGEAADAVLDGSHVWGYSILTVTAPDGTMSRWKTQQIVNVSKLGKLFNQWPTRKQK